MNEVRFKEITLAYHVSVVPFQQLYSHIFYHNLQQNHVTKARTENNSGKKYILVEHALSPEYNKDVFKLKFRVEV